MDYDDVNENVNEKVVVVEETNANVNVKAVNRRTKSPVQQHQQTTSCYNDNFLRMPDATGVDKKVNHREHHHCRDYDGD